jgi:hypothetical protein
LIWHKNANLAEFPLNWKEAFDFIEETNHSESSGRIKWRLPRRSELFSLVSHQYINPSLPASHPFENVFNGYYWTQTECSRLPDQAWYIHLGGGRVYRGMKHGSYMVWPVAGKIKNQSANDRFYTDGITTYDSLTNRTWFVGKEPPRVPVTWKEAIGYIKSLSASQVSLVFHVAMSVFLRKINFPGYSARMGYARYARNNSVCGIITIKLGHEALPFFFGHETIHQ